MLEEHLAMLVRAFKTLANNQLCLKFSKCAFIHSSIKFLGNVVSDQGIHIYDLVHLVQFVRNFPLPKSVSRLCSFLGLCNYRKLVKEHASNAHWLEA